MPPGAVFPSDDQTHAWLTAQGRVEDFRVLDTSGSDYEEVVHLDLSELEPLIAVPHSPGDVVPVRDVERTEIVQVCVGSSVNGSYEDLATVAAFLRDATVADGLQVTATPGSRQILDTISRSGVYHDLLAAGVRILEPICGPCIGIGQAPVKGRPSLRTFNRNFPGRSGTAEDRVYLCSPSTAAASALTGRITDPRGHERPPMRPAPAPDPDVVDRHITPVLPAAQRETVQIERGPNLVPPEPPRPPPETISARVGIVVGDDISTGDMAPDGAIGMAVWSNIAACSRYMFQRIDPEFPERMREWGGGIIVAGDNYGQGSSREHAALSAQYLGVPAVVARSYARIHRRNLVAVGILPLELTEPSGPRAVEVGQTWRIDGVTAALTNGSTAVVAQTDAGEVPLRLSLSDSERQVLLAGGLLAHLRGSDRQKVQAPRHA